MWKSGLTANASGCLVRVPLIGRFSQGYLAISAGDPKLIPDTHLAALAIEHGLALCSYDGDFARFKGLRWISPVGL